MRSVEDGIVIERSDIPPDELRQFALYWDRIDVPDNNMIHLGLGADGDMLAQAGLLTRTKVHADSIKGGEIVDLFLASQLIAKELHEQESPGEWAIAQTPLSEFRLFAPSTQVEESRTVLVELSKCLPSPTADVPMAEILEFKESYQDELQRLRVALDSLYAQVANAQDQSHQFMAAKRELRQAIIDIHRISQERFPARRLLTSLGVELSVPVGLFTYLVTSTHGLDIGKWVAAAVASITFNPSRVWARHQLPQRLEPYAYLRRVDRQLGSRRKRR